MQLPEAVTLEQADELLQQLEHGLAASAAGELHIDASAARQFDTATLALLLEAQRRAQRQGGTLVISGAPPKLIELARLYGVDTLLPLGAAD